MSPNLPEWVRRPWIEGAAVVALAVVAHATTLSGGFVFDDAQALVAARGARWPVDLRAIFGEPTWGAGAAYGAVGLWRPLVTLSFALTDGLVGLEPLVYRATNLALHAAVALAVLALGRRLIGRAGALAAAALYAVHPVTTEAIAVASNRTEGASALLVLLGLLALRGALAADGGRRWARVGLAAAAYGAALLCKESAVTFLGAAVLLDLALRAQGRAHRSWRLRAGAAVAFGAVTVAWLGARVAAIPSPFGGTPSPVDNPIVGGGIPSRLLTPMKVVATAAESLLLPLRLSADYTWAVIRPATWGDPLAWAGVAVLVAVVAGIALTWRRRPGVAFGLGLLAVTFSLASNIVVVSTVIYGDRLLTLPLAGAAMAVGAAVRGRARWALVPVVGALAAGSLAWGASFHDERALFERSLAHRPGSARLHANLGRLLLLDGDPSGARAHLDEALRLHPGAVEARQTLALIVADEGDVDGALRLLEEAVALRRGLDPRAWTNLCAMRLRAGRDDAEAACREAVARDPSLALAWANLGAALDGHGDRGEARAAHDRAVALAPEDPAVLDRLGAHLAAGGDEAALWDVMLRRWRARPYPPELAADVGALTLRLADRAMRAGRVDEARRLLATAWEALPDRGVLAHQLAAVELVAGRPAEARRWAERAIEAGATLSPGLRRALQGPPR